jgi:hypothetical protein
MSQAVYDLAISYASEDRKVSREISQRLLAIGYKIFFDEYERAQLWGADLSSKLGEIYGKDARYCLIVISDSYARKSWTNHERQFAIGRALQEREAYILPLRVDDTMLPGLAPTVGYIDLRSVSIAEVVQLLVTKLGQPLGKTGTAGEDVSQESIQSVLAACYRRAVFTRFHAQMDHESMLESLADCRASLQKIAVYVHPAAAQQLVGGIIGEIDLIERTVKHKPFEFETIGTVDQAKLRILKSLLALADIAQLPVAFPATLTEELMWSRQEADMAPEGPPSAEWNINQGGGLRA